MKTRPCASAVKLPRMLRVLCGCFLAFSTQLAAGQVSSVHIAAPPPLRFRLSQRRLKLLWR